MLTERELSVSLFFICLFLNPKWAIPGCRILIGSSNKIRVNGYAGEGMHSSGPQNITQLLRNFNREKPEVRDKLFRQVYDELYKCAKSQRNRWVGDYTLNTTALVNESYLKLVDQEFDDIQSRSQFYALASKAMRHILINYARDKQRQKRGGGKPKISLDELDFAPQGKVELNQKRSELLLILDNALQKLEDLSPRQCKIIECRYFGGMTIKETATALGVSTMTVKRGWKVARLWLHREMQKELE
jgi:RNA polymerase sigma factor (TIGR02999 family)